MDPHPGDSDCLRRASLPLGQEVEARTRHPSWQPSQPKCAGVPELLRNAAPVRLRQVRDSMSAV